MYRMPGGKESFDDRLSQKTRTACYPDVLSVHDTAFGCPRISASLVVIDGELSAV